MCFLCCDLKCGRWGLFVEVICDWIGWVVVYFLLGMWFEVLGSYRGFEVFIKMWLLEREVCVNLKIVLESVLFIIFLFLMVYF